MITCTKEYRDEQYPSVCRYYVKKNIQEYTSVVAGSNFSLNALSIDSVIILFIP